MTLFKKYFISYLIFFTVALLSSFIIGSGSILTHYRNDVIRNNESNTIISKTQVDQYLDELSTILYQMRRNPTFSAFNLEEDPLKAQSIINTLDTYSAVNFFESMILFYNDGNYVFTPSSSSPKKLFFEKIFSISQMDQNQLEEELRTIENRKIFSGTHTYNGVSTEGLVIAYPFCYGAETNRIGSVLFLISNSVLSRMLQDGTTKLLIIADENNDILYATPSMDSQTARALSSSDYSNNTRVQIGTNMYYGYKISSADSRLIYYGYAECDSVLSSFNNSLILFLLLLVLTIILGTVLAFLLSRYNITPINKLYAYAIESVDGGFDYPLAKNEIDAISTVLDKIKAENRELADMTQQIKPIAIDAFIFSILSGNICESEYNTKAIHLGFAPLMKILQCCILYNNESSHNIIFDKIKECYNILLSINTTTTSILPKITIDMDRIIIIINAETEEEIRKARQEIQRLGNTYDYNTEIGAVCHTLNEVKPSYISLLKQIDNTAGATDTTEKFSSLFHILQRNDKTLIEPLSQENQAQIKKAIQNYLLSADPINIDNNLKNAIAMHLLLKLSSLSEKGLAEINFNNSYSSLYENLLNWSASNDFLPTAKEKEIDIQNVLALIDRHVFDPNFSIQFLSDAFNKSPSKICQFFTFHTNTTILAYVTEKKMAHACFLLQNTAMTVNEISSAVGYNNTSSFIRRFKQIIGMSPSDWRNLSKS